MKSFRRFVLAALFYCALSTSFSQQASLGKVYESELNDKTVSFKELMETIINSDKHLTLRNVTVRWKDEVDRPYIDGRYFSKGKVDTVIVKNYTSFISCDFDPSYWLLLRNIVFENHVLFHGCRNIKTKFMNCHFKRSLQVSSNEVEFMEFDGGTFNEGFKLVRSNVTDFMKFDSVNFDFHLPTDMKLLGLDMDPVLFEINNRVEAINLEVNGCTFNVAEELAGNRMYFVKFSNSTYNRLKITNNVFNSNVDISESTVDNVFLLRANAFSRSVILNSLTLNELSSKIEWESLKHGKLGILQDSMIYHSTNLDDRTTPFTAYDLFNSYATLYNSFRSQGNRMYANSCFVEWKDAETEWMGRNYSSSHNEELFFVYIMNRFLKTFCDYGTSPVKAVIISLYIVAAFALLFLFSSELNPKKHSNLSILLGRVFSYAGKPKEFIQHRKEDISQANESVGFDFSSRLESFFARIYSFELPILKFINRNINRPKFLFYPMYSLALVLLVFNLLVVKLFETTIISLNVYSTLGFGVVPQIGIYRVLSILEGVCGWFLLSIFSVSLISQVLQ